MGVWIRRTILVLSLALVFLGGFSLALMIDRSYYSETDMPSDSNDYEKYRQAIYLALIEQDSEPADIIAEKIKQGPIDRDSPYNRIKEEDIRMTDNRVTIYVDDAVIARFTDTKSMEPTIDSFSNAIEISPSSMDDIQIGDIISYDSSFTEGSIIHRVVEKNMDNLGEYVITKGDNLDYKDPEKIRFEQINRVVIGILY